jgi:hypothetical protein
MVERTLLPNYVIDVSKMAAGWPTGSLEKSVHGGYPGPMQRHCLAPKLRMYDVRCRTVVAQRAS